MDAVLALALFVAVVAYLSAMPLNLQGPDEARHLDHAKRLLDGDVLYRDVFDITTPGWVLVMSAAFSLFGTTLAVARTVNAVIHGLIAAATFALCRRLGVRRVLAVACAVAGVIPTQLFFGASYHWLASLLALGLLLVCVGGSRSPPRIVGIGAVVGLVVAVHQRRGAALGAGTGAFLVAQWALDRLHGIRLPPHLLARQLGALAAGALVVLIPTFAAMVLWAGMGPVWECLVTAPLANYRHAMHTHWGNSWGSWNPQVALVRSAPVVLLPAAALTVVLACRARWRELARQHLLLTVFGLTALWSIAYFPDVTHLALTAGVFFVILADLVEHGLRLLPHRWNRALGIAVAAAAMLGSAASGYQWLICERRTNTFPYESAFGRIHLANAIGTVPVDPAFTAAYYDQLRALVDTIPGRILYVHHRAIYTHLLVGARNPTRYDLVVAPTYTTDVQMREIIASLRDEQVPYILWTPTTPGRDLVARYILERYEQPQEPMPLALSLWRLKSLGTEPTEAAGHSEVTPRPLSGPAA